MAKNAKDRDRALALGKPGELEPDTEMDGDTALEDVNEEAAEALGSKVIVVHIGSQNLRIGLASDALPKTVPMVIARKSAKSESEEEGVEPKPKKTLMPAACSFGIAARIAARPVNASMGLSCACSQASPSFSIRS